MNWASLRVSVVAAAKAKGLTGEKLVAELQVPAKAFSYDEEGCKFYAELGIAVQGQSAQDAWKEVRRLADKFAIPVDVRFQWAENPKSQHPGKIGVIRAGQ